MNSSRSSLHFPGVYLVIVALNILLFVAGLFEGGDLMSPSKEYLIAWGANIAPLTLSGEPWRLLASMFLHIGLVHLGLNMYMLMMFGPIVERQFGPVRFALVYLISGLLGSLVSALVHAVPGQVVIAAGASGALMGISGAYLGHWLVAGARNHARETISIHGPLAQTIGLTLLLGFINPGVDNACHIGGLIGGALMGGAFALGSFDNSKLKRAIATVAISAGGLFCVYLGLNAPPSAGLLELRTQMQAEQD
jgi:rhomboid protease GluP